jgi:spore maturation protein CgeB
MPLKKILISFDDYFSILSCLKKEFEELDIEVNIFSTNKSQHWLNRFVYKKINKIAKKIGLIPNDHDLFSWSRFCYENFRDRQFADRIKEFQPDLILCIHGHWIGEAILREINIPKLGWWVEPNINRVALIKFASLFDNYLSYDSETVELLRNHNICSEYQSHVASTSDFYPIPEIEKDIDVLFYGSWSPWREEVLFSAYKATNNIALYVNEWQKNCVFFSKKDLKKILRGRNIVGSNLNDVMNSSKIVLGAQRLKEFTTGLDTRAFDALASGALLLTDAPKDLHRHFKNQEDCLVYEHSEEVPGLVRAVLDGQVEVEKIRRSGRKKVLLDFTYKILCKKISNHFNLGNSTAG